MDRNSFFMAPAAVILSSPVASSSGLFFFTFNKHASLFVTFCLCDCFFFRVTLVWMDVRESLVLLDSR